MKCGAVRAQNDAAHFMSDDEADTAPAAPAPSLGEMLLSEGVGSAADWVQRNRHVTAIKAAREEREQKAKGASGCLSGATLTAPRHPSSLCRVVLAAPWACPSSTVRYVCID